MFNILHAAPLLILLAASTLVHAQSDPRPLQEEDKYVRAVLIVPPAFRELDPTMKLPVEIRVKGTVNDKGVMESVEYSPVEGNEKFIAAIERVLPLWIFRPAVDGVSCAPIASTGVLLVWFEERDGKPVVSVSMPKMQPPAKPIDAKPAPVPRDLEIRPKATYPRSARRAGMEGTAELLFKVDQKGEVLQTRVVYSSPLKEFGEEALAGARRVKFSAAAADADIQKAICIVAPYVFCLPDGAKHPSPACQNRKFETK